MDDNILMFGKDEKEHRERLVRVLKQLESAHVTLNPSKCEFSRDKIKFLGHIIDRTGVKADPDKTDEAPMSVSD